MKYLIANLVTEYEPRYESLKKLTQPFIYEGEKEADIVIGVNDARIRSLLSEMTQDSDLDDAEGLAVSSEFSRKAILSARLSFWKEENGMLCAYRAAKK